MSVHVDQLAWLDRSFTDPVEDTQRRKRSCPVGTELNSCSDFAELLGRLEDMHLEFALGERQRARQSTDAAANDERLCPYHHGSPGMAAAWAVSARCWKGFFDASRRPSSEECVPNCRL